MLLLQEPFFEVLVKSLLQKVEYFAGDRAVNASVATAEVDIPPRVLDTEEGQLFEFVFIFAVKRGNGVFLFGICKFAGWIVCILGFAITGSADPTCFKVVASRSGTHFVVSFGISDYEEYRNL